MNTTKLVVLFGIVGIILAVNYQLDLIVPVPLLVGASTILIVNLFKKLLKSTDK